MGSFRDHYGQAVRNESRNPADWNDKSAGADPPCAIQEEVLGALPGRLVIEACAGKTNQLALPTDADRIIGADRWHKLRALRNPAAVRLRQRLKGALVNESGPPVEAGSDTRG